MWPVVPVPPEAPQSRALYCEQAQKQVRLVVLATALVSALVSVGVAAVVLVAAAAVAVVRVVSALVHAAAVGVAPVVVVAVVPAAVAVVVVVVQQKQAHQRYLVEPELAVSEIRPGRHSVLAVGYVGYNYYP